MAQRWQELGKLGRFAVVTALGLFVWGIVLSVRVHILEEYINEELPATTIPAEKPTYPARLITSK